jgi:hypothetical protein
LTQKSTIFSKILLTGKKPAVWKPPHPKKECHPYFFKLNGWHSFFIQQVNLKSPAKKVARNQKPAASPILSKPAIFPVSRERQFC